MQDKLVELLYYEKIIGYGILAILILAGIVSCIIIVIEASKETRHKK